MSCYIFLALPGYGAHVCGGVFVDMDPDGGIWEEVLDEFWPFDEAEGTAVEVVIEADVVGFFEAADAVEVEMVDAVY